MNTASSDSSLKICSHCSAPNPARLVTCFACGRELTDALNLGAPSKQVVRHMQCPNCLAELPSFGSDCAECGRVGSEYQSVADSTVRPADANDIPSFLDPLAMMPRELYGWNIQPLNAREVRLSRTLWRRVCDDVPIPLICLLCAGLVFYSRGGRGPTFGAMGLSIAASALLLLIGIGAAIWQFGAREEISVGPMYFERTKTLGSYVRRWRFDPVAQIRVDTRRGSDRSGSYIVRKLIIEDLGKKLTLDRRMKRDGIFSFWNTPLVYEDDVSGFGLYLAEVTGWQFTDPSIGQASSRFPR